MSAALVVNEVHKYHIVEPDSLSCNHSREYTRVHISDSSCSHVHVDATTTLGVNESTLYSYIVCSNSLVKAGALYSSQ